MSVGVYDEVPFTELLREPSATAGRLNDTRRLRLRRRDAEDLMLQSAERAAREDEVIDLSARLLAGLVHETGGALILRRILPQALPWVTFLPAGAVDELVAELVSTLQAAVSIDNLWPVSQLLVEWRHTAEIYADPVLYKAVTRVLGEDGGPVPPPEVRGRPSLPIRGPNRRANATTSSSTLSRLASTEAGSWNSGSTR